MSDLRSKPQHIDFDSNTCPACKKVFHNKNAAKVHFKVVHLKKQLVKCPHPQCFTRASTVANLRAHFNKAHPNATLPKDFEKRPKVRVEKHTICANDLELKSAEF